MKRLFALVAAGAFVGHSVALSAQFPPRSAGEGPIGRGIAREAARLQPTGKPPANGSRGVVQLRWTELSPVITGRRVEVSLPERGTVGGTVYVVRDTELVLGIGRLRRAELSVPRGSVGELTLLTVEGTLGRRLGETVGLALGIPLAFRVAWATQRVGGGSLGLLPVFGGFALGHHLGKAADTRKTRIVIIE